MKGRFLSFASVVVAAPILLLIGGAVAALCLSTSSSDVWSQLRQQAVQDAILLSFKTTLISVLIIVACGTPLALLIYRHKGLVGSGLELLITLPAIMPPSVAGLSLLLAFGRNGLFGKTLDSFGITLAFTTAAVVMAQTFVATPFYVREAANAFQAIDPSIIDAAKIDGASGTKLAKYIIVPMAAPFLITGAILSWARALSEFGATILFAGSLQGVTQTLPIAIYFGFETSLTQAKAMAIVLLFVAAGTLALLRVLLRRSFVYAH